MKRLGDLSVCVCVCVCVCVFLFRWERIAIERAFILI